MTFSNYRRRHGSISVMNSDTPKPHTVSALKPKQALTVHDAQTITEAAQLMAAKRADCVLVLDEDDHLAGIFTAKDLAFRVVAESLDTRQTLVSDIMTRAPFCVTEDTAASDALSTMVQRHFRHLPVCDQEGQVIGILDITKCMYEAIEKMERAYTSSKKLCEAMEGVDREWAAVQPAAFVEFVEELRTRMNCPDLNSVVGDQELAAVGVKNSVRDAARIMKERQVTAVVVMEGGQIAGIFTSKDVVLRVIAAGLNPDTCSVVRVMTPRPDMAPPTMTALDALRKMHDGRYLNLPVVDGQRVVGVVDVLKLTCVVLEQINSVSMGNNFLFNPTGNEEVKVVIQDFVFKFKDPTDPQKVHRFQHPIGEFSRFMRVIRSKVVVEILNVCYIDEDGDKVVIAQDVDIQDAVSQAQKQGQSKVQLVVSAKPPQSQTKERMWIGLGVAVVGILLFIFKRYIFCHSPP